LDNLAESLFKDKSKIKLRQDFGHLRKTKIREIILSNSGRVYWNMSSVSGLQVWSLAFRKATQHSPAAQGFRSAATVFESKDSCCSLIQN
jgi:hypothetical protein